MATATPIGFRDGSDDRQPVCIPLELRLQHTHVIGHSGTGKSTLIERMALHDIQEGHGVAVLDPCGSLVERLMRLVQPRHVDRVIYLKPGDPDWTPIWNPLRPRIPLSPAQIAGSLTRVLLPGNGFGDRSEHILRQAILAALQLPSGSLRDAMKLLRRRDRQGARLRSRVLRMSDDEMTRDFWRLDFARYSSFDLEQSSIVLHRLLTSGPCSRMLSYGESSIDLPDVMNTGKILLLDLSSVSSEARDIIGRLMLALLHLAPEQA